MDFAADVTVEVALIAYGGLNFMLAKVGDLIEART